MKSLETINPKKLWKAIVDINKACSVLGIENLKISDDLAIVNKQMVVPKELQDYLVENKIITIRKITF